MKVSVFTDDGIEHVYVDGGTNIQGFLSGGLIDEITITARPVILESGISLFGATKNDTKLLHLNVPLEVVTWKKFDNFLYEITSVHKDITPLLWIKLLSKSAISNLEFIVISVLTLW